jgi:hypothetical protein
MADQRTTVGKIPRSELRDGYDALAIARLRKLITISEAHKRRRDFAEAIRRLETAAARSKMTDRTV